MLREGNPRRIFRTLAAAVTLPALLTVDGCSGGNKNKLPQVPPGCQQVDVAPGETKSLGTWLIADYLPFIAEIDNGKTKAHFELHETKVGKLVQLPKSSTAVLFEAGNRIRFQDCSSQLPTY